MNQISDDTTQRILDMLAVGGSLSGQEMGERLGVTRAAVWKRIQSLREQGFDIRGAGRGGYRLEASPGALHPVYWKTRLRTVWMGREAVFLPQVDSTNAQAKRLAAEGAARGLLVLADRQTQGRGRRGRGWESPPGVGLWMSLVLRPTVEAERAPSLALMLALAVSAACRRVCGAQAGVKWPNDVLIDGKKVCGILVEMAADMDGVQWVVAGMGVNVSQTELDFPPELRETATSLALARPGGEWRRADLLLALLEELEARYADWEIRGVEALRREYAATSVTLGRNVEVLLPDGHWGGRALDIDDTGALLVRCESGEIRRVLAADVSVRGESGYA